MLPCRGVGIAHVQAGQGDDLTQFREEWRRELHGNVRQQEAEEDEDEEDDLHVRARSLFLLGVQVLNISAFNVDFEPPCRLSRAVGCMRQSDFIREG